MVKLVSALVVFLVVAVFLLYNNYFAVNFPFQDDLVLVNFVSEVMNGVSTSKFFALLFRADNDHKVVIPRLIAWVNYLIGGRLNFRLYIGLVSINLLYILYFLYLQFRKIKVPFYYFLPVPFLFLQPQHYEVSLWAINGMQHSFLTAFFVTAILLVSRRTTPAYFGAIFFCYLATFTHGNGILSFPAILFYFLCHKDFKKALGVAGFMVLALVLYLSGYESGQAAGLPTGVEAVVYNLFGFIGANLDQWEHGLLYSTLWGVLIVALAGYFVWKIAFTYLDRKAQPDPRINLELLTLFCFIFITSLVVAVFRSWMGSTLVSRFQLYAALSSCIFYLLLLGYRPALRRVEVLLPVLGLCIVFWAHSYYRYTPYVEAKRTTYLADIFNWENNRMLLSVDQSLLNNAAFYVFPAYERGILTLPPPVISHPELDASFQAQKVLDVPLSLDSLVVMAPGSTTDTTEVMYYIVNDTFPKAPLLGDRFLVLKSTSTDSTYLAAANPKPEGRKALLTRTTYYKDGFVSYVRKNNFPPGTYQIGVLDVGAFGQKRVYRLKEKVRIEEEKITLNR